MHRGVNLQETLSGGEPSARARVPAAARDGLRRKHVDALVYFRVRWARQDKAVKPGQLSAPSGTVTMKAELGARNPWKFNVRSSMSGNEGVACSRLA